MRSTALSVLLAVCLSAGGSATAGPITVDGNYSDWGITPGTNWTPSVGMTVFLEDYTHTDGTGFVGPGYGGQFFDVEAIYAYRSGDKLSFGIVTGFDPDGVNYYGTIYKAGDIFFDVGSGWKVAVELHTKDIYVGAQGTTAPEFPASSPVYHKAGTGTKDGQASLSVPFDGVMAIDKAGSTSTKHYFIEGALDLATVGGGGKEVGIHWTMSCGNDLGEGRIPYRGGNVPVPEPATLTLLGLALVGLGLRRRK